MRDNDGIPDNKLAGRGVSAINRDVAAFTFFLFLSFGLWYINSLGKEAEADVRFPFRYVNVPSARTLVSESASNLSFSLKGPGYSLLKLKVSGDRPPVLIDLSKVSYKRVPESKNGDYYLATSSLIKSLTIQIRTGCEIIAIKPDTLWFTLTRVKPVPDPKQDREH